MINPLFSQTTNFYPDQFGSTPQTLSLINPVYLDLTPLQGIKLGTKNNTGPFNEIRTFYTQGSLTLKQNNNEHWIGADFISEQEGPVIRKNRMRFNYAIKKELTNKLFISLGTHLGLSSFDYNGSKSTSQGSSIGPDGSLALLVKYKSWRLGTHINQIFNQIYQPKTTTFSYPTYYGYYIDKSWEMPNGAEIRLYYLSQVLKYHDNTSSLGINYDYRDLLGISAIYHHNRFLTPTFYFDAREALNNTKGFQLYFSYNIPIQELKDSKISSVEMGLIISFTK